ncbi:MAG: hypothetical protein WBP89_05600 [Sedimenticolaceae bacterium]
MAEFDRIFSFDKQGAALQQLDRAILLFLNEKDFVSSITLAGAAEEILGALVSKAGGTPCVTDQARRLKESKLPHLSEKQIAFNHLNLARNALKHFNLGSSAESVGRFQDLCAGADVSERKRCS